MRRRASAVPVHIERGPRQSSMNDQGLREIVGANTYPASGPFSADRVDFPAVAAAAQILPRDHIGQVERPRDSHLADNLRLDECQAKVVVRIRRCSLVRS